jgi:hypothetical protein
MRLSADQPAERHSLFPEIAGRKNPGIPPLTSDRSHASHGEILRRGDRERSYRFPARLGVY